MWSSFVVFVFCRTKQGPIKTSIPTWSKSWSPPCQNSASQLQKSWALTSYRLSRWDCTILLHVAWESGFRKNRFRLKCWCCLDLPLLPYVFAGLLYVCTVDHKLYYAHYLLATENLFCSLSSGHLMYKEMSSPDCLLSNMSILLIKSMLSCCVQNGGPNKENQ